jgi:hypothetical protein
MAVAGITNCNFFLDGLRKADVIGAKEQEMLAATRFVDIELHFKIIFSTILVNLNEVKMKNCFSIFVPHLQLRPMSDQS